MAGYWNRYGQLHRKHGELDMIRIDDDGNFTTDAAGHLQTAPDPAVQSAKAECRCIQGSWDADPYFGRNQIVWSVSQSPRDRSADLFRIVQKYAPVMSVSFDTDGKKYNIQVA